MGSHKSGTSDSIYARESKKVAADSAANDESIVNTGGFDGFIINWKALPQSLTEAKCFPQAF